MRELYFAKRDLGFCPVGMAAFIFLLPPFIFPAGFRSYDWVSHIGVISSSQTCLSAGADNCTGLSMKQKARGREKESGREIQTDRPLIYSHLLQSFLIDLACLHQQPDPGNGFFFFISRSSLDLWYGLDGSTCQARVSQKSWKWTNQAKDIIYGDMCTPLKKVLIHF